MLHEWIVHRRSVELAANTGGKERRPSEGEPLTALQPIRQACPGADLEIQAITLQRHLTEKDREVTTGSAIDNQGE